MWGGCIHACVGEAATKGDDHKCVAVSNLPEGKKMAGTGRLETLTQEKALKTL